MEIGILPLISRCCIVRLLSASLVSVPIAMHSSVPMQIVQTFPSGEYHLGGDEVWAVPWANSSTVQKWIATHGLGDGGSGCPDDPTVSCGNIGDIQPYFTRKVSSLSDHSLRGSLG